MITLRNGFRGLRAMPLLPLLAASLLGASHEAADAAKSRDTQAIRALIGRHTDVNTPQPDGATALHWAAHWDDRDMAGLLIHGGANVNAADDEGVTPLLLACINGSGGMVKLLLEAGGNASAAGAAGETPLMMAAQTGNTEVLGLLLAHGADVNAKESSRGQTALMLASAGNHDEAEWLLISHGANVQARSHNRFTALLFAAQQGNIAIAKMLLGAGGDVNDTAPDGIGGDTNARLPYKPNTEASALLVAIDSGHEAMAQFLLDHGADVNQHGAGRTALHSAVQQSMPELVKKLLARGADPNARLEKPMPLLSRIQPPQTGLDVNSAGATPFWLASDYCDLKIMRILASAGADTRMPSKDGTTPLMMAAGVNYSEGQDRYGRRWYQDTTLPLQQAALEAAKLALELGGEVNAKNVNGQTALHGAAYMGSSMLVHFLVDHGAKLDAQNRFGQTPYVITQGVYLAGTFVIRKDTAELLRQLGADTKLGLPQGENQAAKRE